MATIRLTRSQFVKDMADASRKLWKLFPGADKLLEELAGLPCIKVLFSNQTAVWRQEVIDQLAIDQYFDFTIFSCDAGVEAPKSHESLRMFSRLHELGSRCRSEPIVFSCLFDDRWSNLEMARKSGLHPYWVDLDVVDPVEYVRYMLGTLSHAPGFEHMLVAVDMGGILLADHAEELLWGPGGFAETYHRSEEITREAHTRLWYDDRFDVTPPTTERDLKDLEYEYYSRLADYTGLEVIDVA